MVALQGEIGASTMKCRDIKYKLEMVNHMKYTENSLLKAEAERMVETRSGGWIKQVEEYMHTIGTSYAELTTMKRERINLRVNEWEERRWRTEVGEKETLKIYGVKKKITEEGLYSHDSSSVTLFRCRTNMLKLNW